MYFECQANTSPESQDIVPKTIEELLKASEQGVGLACFKHWLKWFKPALLFSSEQKQTEESKIDPSLGRKVHLQPLQTRL